MDMMSGFGMQMPPTMSLMGGGGFPGLGGGSPLLGGAPALGLGMPGLDGFSASPEMAGEAAHPWASGKTGFEGLDVNMPLGGTGTTGMPDLSQMMAGLGGGLDLGMGGLDMGMGGLDMGLGGGSLANQAAMLQAGMGDANLANAALMGAEAVGMKNGAMQGQILGDAATLGLA